MTGPLLLALLAAQPALPERTIVLSGTREPVVVSGFSDTIGGTCDGQKAWVSIVKTHRGVEGSITIGYGDSSRELPSSFARGLLVRHSVYHVALTCDGKRLQLVADVVQMGGGSGAQYFTQRVSWEWATDTVTVSDLQPWTAEEFAVLVP
jgi:hypothetical protein